MPILRASLILVLATACAAEAAGACPAGGQRRVAGHAMLQTSVSSNQQGLLSPAKSMMTATDRMYSQVQAMVSDMVAKGRPLSPGEQAAIELMNATLENTTVPAIHEGHRDDQILMNNALGGLANCETNLASDSNQAASAKQDVNSKAQNHTACRSTESSLESTNKNKQSALDNFHTNLAVPSLPTDVSGLTDFFPQLAQWVSSNNMTYSTKKQEFDSAKSDADSKREDCNKAQTTYEGSYCLWHTSASIAVSTHETCWSQGSSSFNTTKTTVLDEAEQRKAEYTGTRKIQCLLNVLNGGIEGIQARLDACAAMTVGTSFLDLVNTSMPSKSQPDLGNLTFVPGDAAWLAEMSGYGIVPGNAPTVPVTECAGTERTSAGPETLY